MKVRRTSEDWLELHRQQKSSGFSTKEWCEKNDVSLHSMSNRVCKLRKAGLIVDKRQPRGMSSVKKTKATTPELTWVEVPRFDSVKSAEDSSVSKAEISSATGISVEVRTFRVNISAGFCEESFLRVCKALISI